jgi:GT2 family glycosyltransferase/glycosyltransferase involved in cell wall biosynthesis
MKKIVKSRTSRRGVRGPKAQSAKRRGPTRVRADTRRRAIVVLGMHRSGTSALTRVINLLGADLPSNLMGANWANEAGYFESNDLVTIHDAVLKSAGSDWQDWRPFNPDWYSSPAAPAFKERVLGVLRHDYSQSRLFVLKDPRACRFFPFCRDVLEEFGAAPAVAIPVRNPLEVMASLRQRDGFPLAKAALIWLRHVIDAERTTRDLPRTVVTYDALLSDWQGVIASLGAGLDVSWPRRGAAAELEIERFLATKLRHHVATPESLATRAEIVDWVKDAYAALVQLSLTPEHRASKAQLDRVGAEFDKASAAFGVALAETERDIIQHEAESAELRARAGALEQRIAALSDRETAAAKLTAELDSAGAALAAERQAAAKLTAEFDSAGAALAAERQGAAKLAADLDSAGAALAAERYAAAEQAARLTAIEHDSALAQAGRAEAVEEARRSRAERDAAKETLEHAHRTLSIERQRAAEQADQLAELARERERAEASRAAAVEDARQLRAELGVQARIAAEQSGMIGHFLAIQARAEQESVAHSRRVEELEQALAQEAGARKTVVELEAEIARFAAANLALATQLEERTARTAQLEADVNAANRVVETSHASAAGRTAALQGELSAAMRRDAEMEASYHRINSELVAIKRTPGWNLLEPVRRFSASAATWSNRRLIERSGLFDRDWYVANYPEIDASASDPLLDYLQRGAAEGRNPSPLFLGGWYLEQYPDVRATGMNPLVHFLRHGAREGRNPSSLFETEWYRTRYPDVRTSGINPLAHYALHGAAEGRDPGPFFDTAWYLAEHPDVKAAGLNPLAHYLEYGMGEGRRPNPLGKTPSGWEADARPPRWQTHVVPPKPVDRYTAWLACNEFREPARLRLRAELAARRERVPRISVVIPVHNTPQHLLDQAIRSVVDQVYEGWELCIADDASTAPDVAECLKRWAAADERIHVVRRDHNGGIGAATNSAAAVARSEFLTFLDHDDLLSPDALAEVAIYAADHADTDIIYSDDDKIDMDGRRYAPQFKPDWSPVLLLSYMYPSHLLVVRRSLFEALDGMRDGFDGSQDHDLTLRASERARRIGHIPRVLYHWRAAPDSRASSAETKPHSFAAGRRAVADAFARRGFEAAISQPDWAKAGKVGIFAATFPDDGPRVSILIPTKNRLDLLKACVDSLAATTYRNYEVVIIDNESDDPATLAFLSDCSHRVLHVASPGGKFSFAHINNAAVRAVTSEFVLFLNNDTEVVTGRWLSQMMGYARMPGVGAVGAKLRYRDATVQHGGIVHGYHDGLVGHAFKNMPVDDWGYLGYMRVAREFSGVTAACMLTPRALFLELGGLDETEFAVAYNDVDYCYRLGDRGYRSIVCPDAELIHDEGKSRGLGDNPDEITALRRRYGRRPEPYYSPNLSLDHEQFEIRPYRHPRSNGVVRAVAVTHNLNREGAPYAQFEMIVGLQRRGLIDPIVLSPHEGPLRADYERAGITVGVVTPPDIGARAQFERSIAELGKAFCEFGPDVIYANTLQTFWVIAAAETVGLPSLWHVHESEPWQSYFEFLRPELQEVAYGCFAFPYRVVLCSNATRRTWEPFNRHHNFTVIPGGLDVDRVRERSARYDRASARDALGIRDDEVAITLLGTVCERKGQLDLVNALRLLPEELPSTLHVFIVGDRPNDYSSKVHAEVRRLPAKGRVRVHIVPETGEPLIYLQASDIGVCSSRSEGYPRVILEKMYFGLALITTPVFGIAEQVRRDVNGLFYQPGDVAQLAAHLTRLVTDAKLRARLGGNGPRVLRSLPSLADTVDGFHQLFQQARLG